MSILKIAVSRSSSDRLLPIYLLLQDLIAQILPRNEIMTLVAALNA